MDKATGNDLINFIKENRLEGVPVETDYVEGLVFSVYLDDTHRDMIEYFWVFKGADEISQFHFNDDDECSYAKKSITASEALKLRGLG